MTFDEVDWELYSKPPFFPGWLSKDDTLKLAKIPHEKLTEIQQNIKTLSNQYDEDIIKDNTSLIDRRGSLLGLKRQGQSNSDYFQLQNLRRLLNLNKSTVNDIIKILKTYYNNETIEIVPDYPAGIHILHYGQSEEKVDFNQFIVEVIGAGISFATEEYFKFEENLKIKDTFLDLHKFDLDDIHYDGRFTYNGLVQYGNMRPSRQGVLYYDGTIGYDGNEMYDNVQENNLNIKEKLTVISINKYDFNEALLIKEEQVQLSKYDFETGLSYNGDFIYNGYANYNNEWY